MKYIDRNIEINDESLNNSTFIDCTVYINVYNIELAHLKFVKCRIFITAKKCTVRGIRVVMSHITGLFGNCDIEDTIFESCITEEDLAFNMCTFTHTTTHWYIAPYRIKDCFIDWGTSKISYGPNTDVRGTNFPIPSKYLEQNFEFTEEGMIVYVCFNDPPVVNNLQDLIVNHHRTAEYGSGVIAYSLEGIEKRFSESIYKCLVPYKNLADVVVPFVTDRYIFCGTVIPQHKINKN